MSHPSSKDCEEWKDKYEKCMKDSGGHFDRCMHLLTQSFWCSIEKTDASPKK